MQFKELLRKHKFLFLLAFLSLTAVAFVGYSFYVYNLEKYLDDQDTVVYMQSTLQPDSEASLRVVALNHKDMEGINNAKIRVVARDVKTNTERTLFDGVSGKTGTADISFKIPGDMQGDYDFKILTESGVGRDVITRSVKIEKDYRILLSTDKPLYQPSQTIHVRALAMEGIDSKPASRVQLTFVIEDPKANKLYKKTIETSEYGVAGTDFTLGEEVNTGLYTVRATIDKASEEKKVTVTRYVLPKFRVEYKPDKTYYLPGESLSASVKANYFFGKPVSGSQVKVEIYTYEGNIQKIADIHGTTDQEGNYDLEYTLPDHFIGLPLEKGSSLLFFNVTVTDNAQHSETISSSVPVSKDAIIIDIIPESGRLVKNLENILYIVTAYPDGKPAPAAISVNGESVATNGYGIGEYRTIPKTSFMTLDVSAKDSSGHTGSAKIEFPKDYIQNPKDREEYNHNGMLQQEDYLPDSILLRVGQPVYKVGETMQIDVFSTASKGSVYIDVIKDKQTVITRSADLKAGHASASVNLDASLAGTLEVHAYKILKTSDVVRDSKTVYVDRADDVSLQISTDREKYLPASTAVISFLTKYNGDPVPSALGINIVDESVYALAEKEAGFEKYYFELEKEFMMPRYMIYGITLPDIIEKAGAVSSGDRMQIGKVLMAEAPMRDRYDVKKSSRQEKQGKIDAIKADYTHFLGHAALILAFLIPIGICLLPAYSYRKKRGKYIKRFVYSAIATVVIVVISSAGMFLFIAGSNYNWRLGSSERNTLMLGEFAVCVFLSAVASVIWLYALIKDRYRTYVLSAIAIPLLVFFTFMGFAQLASNSYSFGAGLYWLSSMIPLVFLLGVCVCGVFALVAFFYGLFKRRALALGMILSAVYPLAYIAAIILNGPASNPVVYMVAGVFSLLIPVSYFIYSFELMEKKKKIVLFTLPTTLLPFVMLAALLPLLFWQMGVFNVGQGSFAPPATSGMDRNQGVMEEAAGSSSLFGLPGLQQKSLAVDRLTNSQEEFTGTEDTGSESIHVRQYFPETMYSNPQVLTDDKGEARINLTTPDSITSWRITALASTLGGRIGSGNGSLLVYQDFFIDLDLPVSLTQNDEISIPVMVYNYMPEKQIIAVSFREDPWYELLDVSTKQLSLDKNQVGVVYYRIRAKDIGRHRLTVTAKGKTMGDSLTKEIEVLPDGKEIRISETKPLDRDISTTAYIPSDAINGSEKILINIYPGIFSQVVSGLDSMLGMPHGCFEQTSSITYPNVLILEYMKSTNQLTPEIQFKAEGYISAGYQRLLTFEAEPGGFSIFGEKPAERIVTAYGLLVYKDMAKVYPIDEKVISRSQEWLLSQQKIDHWEPDGHYGASYKARNSDLAATCYITWTLLESGLPKDNEKIRRAVAYIEKNVKGKDANTYTLAACSIALAKGGVADTDILGRLSEKATRENDTMYWGGEQGEIEHEYSYRMPGRQADIETTALAALAFMESDYNIEELNKALKYLAQSKDSRGGWGSTQATVLSMKALLYSVSKTRSDTDAKIELYMNGKRVEEITVDNNNKDVLQQIDLAQYTKREENRIDLKLKGKGNIFYQVLTEYYVPWNGNGNVSEKKRIEIKLEYDKKELHTGDIITVSAFTRYNGPGVANYVIIDLGIPPGFDVLTEDLSELASKGVIEKYDVTGRQLIIYAKNLDQQGKYIEYRIKARYSIKAKTPSSRVYDYYNPDISDQSEPIEINTLEKEGNSTDDGEKQTVG